MKHLVVMAGGTGGHVYPGLAVARAMKQRGWRVSWMGTPNGMEVKLVDPQEFPFKGIAFEGIVGRGLLPKLKLPFALLRAAAEAKAHFNVIRPDAVIGMGGFPTVPGGVAAWRMGVPIAIHQSDAVAGAANRLLARVATKVLTGFEGTFANVAKHRNAEVVLTGNPIRNEFTQMPDVQTRLAARSDSLQVLVMGGSRGATALNEMVPAAIAALPVAQRPKVLHQAGAGAAEKTRATYVAAGVDAEVVEFIDAPWQALSDADLLVARSGASTISEVTALGVPVIFVPYPHHADQQQLRNARALAVKGAARIIEQASLTAQSLATTIASFDRTQLIEMGSRAASLAQPQATERICEAIESMVQTQNGVKA